MKLFVSTYAKYSAGSLAGKWLDLADYADLDEFYEACHELHNDEDDIELMFQDSDEFPDFLYTESAPLHEDIYEFVELDDDTKEIVAEYIDNVGLNDLSRLIDEAQEAYMGQYESFRDFAEEYIVGYLTVPTHLENYICVEAVEAHIEDDYFITESGHVFRNI